MNFVLFLDSSDGLEHAVRGWGRMFQYKLYNYNLQRKQLDMILS